MDATLKSDMTNIFIMKHLLKKQFYQRSICSFLPFDEDFAESQGFQQLCSWLQRASHIISHFLDVHLEKDLSTQFVF